MLKEVHVKARKIEKIASDSKYGTADQVINGNQLTGGAHPRRSFSASYITLSLYGWG